MKKATLTTQKKEPTKQTGFTLIELALVLVVMTIITAFTTQAYLWQKDFEREEARADKTIQEIIQIREAMRAWRLDKGNWADVANNCAGAIDLLTNATPTAYLRYVGTVSPYGTDYVTSCDANTFSIEVESRKDYVQYIRTRLAGTLPKSVYGKTTITSMPRNTINPALADFLPLAGTINGPMTGDIDMGNNAITNVADIEFDGQSIKLGISNYVLMDIQPFDETDLIIDKPDCNQGSVFGYSTLILSITSITTTTTTGGSFYDWQISAGTTSSSSPYWTLNLQTVSSVSGTAHTYCNYSNWP